MSNIPYKKEFELYYNDERLSPLVREIEWSKILEENCND